MASILAWDECGKDVHSALRGVMKNVKVGRWKAAMYALKRGWFALGGGGEKSVWRKVVEVVVLGECRLENEEEVEGWEDVVLAAVSLPGAAGCLNSWSMSCLDTNIPMSLLHAAVAVGRVKMVTRVVEQGGELGRAKFSGCDAGTDCM